jgi:hypothetical protein
MRKGGMSTTQLSAKAARNFRLLLSPPTAKSRVEMEHIKRGENIANCTLLAGGDVRRMRKEGARYRPLPWDTRSCPIYRGMYGLLSWWTYASSWVLLLTQMSQAVSVAHRSADVA